MPVQILGWRTLPALGDHFLAVDSEVCYFYGAIQEITTANLHIFILYFENSLILSYFIR